MTNYYFPSHQKEQPEQQQDDTFTREQRQRVAQRKAERKALLDRVRAQREKAYRKVLEKRKPG